MPYNISTTLLAMWLDRLEKFSGFTLMFQKEVAERIVAKPGGKDYGVLSLSVQYYTKPSLQFIIPKEAFRPMPKMQ